MNSFISKMVEEATKHPVIYKAFKKEMIGKMYGTEETFDAWSWFKTGWNAAFDDKAAQR